MTYLSYSSLAIVLLAVSFLATGVIGLNEGLYLVLGANLGSGMLPLISSWNSSVVEKTPIIANLLVRIFCIIIFYPFVDFFAQFFLIFASMELVPALYHLTLNLIVAFIGIAFSSQILGFTSKLELESGTDDTIR